LPHEEENCLFVTGIAYCTGSYFSQTVIKGIIHHGVTNEPVPAVSVVVKGKLTVISDDKGKFHFTINYQLPVTLVVLRSDLNHRNFSEQFFPD
jgi:hypothetical protein